MCSAPPPPSLPLPAIDSPGNSHEPRKEVDSVILFVCVYWREGGEDVQLRIFSHHVIES